MNQFVLTTQTGSDGNLHVDLPAGSAEANTDAQITVSPVPAGSGRTLRASDLIQSGLIGMWEERSDICDSHEFARRLREQGKKAI